MGWLILSADLSFGAWTLLRGVAHIFVYTYNIKIVLSDNLDVGCKSVLSFWVSCLCSQKHLCSSTSLFYLVLDSIFARDGKRS
jgi:hypothetical protein